MILPTKHLSEEKSLIRIGAHILSLLDEPKTVSGIWTEFKGTYGNDRVSASITFSWYVMGMDLLFVLGAIDLDAGRVTRRAK